MSQDEISSNVNDAMESEMKAPSSEEPAGESAAAVVNDDGSSEPEPSESQDNKPKDDEASQEQEISPIEEKKDEGAEETEGAETAEAVAGVIEEEAGDVEIEGNLGSNPVVIPPDQEKAAAAKGEGEGEKTKEAEIPLNPHQPGSPGAHGPPPPHMAAYGGQGYMPPHMYYPPPYGMYPPPYGGAPYYPPPPGYHGAPPYGMYPPHMMPPPHGYPHHHPPPPPPAEGGGSPPHPQRNYHPMHYGHPYPPASPVISPNAAAAAGENHRGYGEEPAKSSRSNKDSQYPLEHEEQSKDGSQDHPDAIDDDDVTEDSNPIMGAPVTARVRVYVKPNRQASQEVLARRSRKNAQSRARASKHREQMMEVELKTPSERDEQEVSLLGHWMNRRHRKNDRSRDRALEKKEEIDRILMKPDSKRTRIENSFLDTALGAKKRKNEGDRLRRTRLKDLGLSPKGTLGKPGIPARGPIPTQYQERMPPPGPPAIHLDAYGMPPPPHYAGVPHMMPPLPHPHHSPHRPRPPHPHPEDLHSPGGGSMYSL
jgi:hypothetical protein